jgi:hypothetical protein
VLPLENGGPRLSSIEGQRDIARLPTKKQKGLAAAARRAGTKLRRFFGSDIPANSAEAKEAVAHFLTAMAAVSAQAFPGWQRVLNDGLSDCTLNIDDRRALFELHPIDDYFFAAVVALEAAKLRSLYNPMEASELLSEIGEQVDARAGRNDRVVSDLVFLTISRIDLGTGNDRMKTPYDKAVKTILQQIGMDRIDAASDLINDAGFRHLLGEPLALGVPQWWRAFHSQFSIYWNEPEPVYMDNDNVVPAAAQPVASSPRRRGRRRAVAF